MQTEGTESFVSTRIAAGAPRGVASRSMPWLTTFGDLLTLLLCFFMFLVSKGAVGRQAHRAVSTGAQVNQGVAASTLSKGGTGISIATSMLEAERLRLRFAQSDFSETGERLSPQALARVQTAVKTARYKVERVNLETCNEASGSQDGKSWSMSVARTLAVRSQLIDAGLEGGLLKLRAVGPHCESFRSAQAGETETVAQVTLILTRQING